MLGRAATWAIAGALVFSSTAWAAGSANQGALPSGHAAGVKEALSFGGKSNLLWLVGGGLVIGGVVLVVTGNGHGTVNPTCPLEGCTPSTTTTTTTDTTTTTTTSTTTTGT